MEKNLMLQDVLFEVRKAYRLVAVYQRRILDMARFIQDHFSEQGYKPYWYLHKYDLKVTSTGASVPTDRWSLDMLPLYNGLSMLYIPKLADANPKKDELLLEIRFDNDDGFEEPNSREPKVENFKPAEECTSKLWLCVFGVLDVKNNWLHNVYNTTEWPISGEIHINEIEKTWSAGKYYDLSEIVDQTKLIDVINDFKFFVDEKKKIILSEYTA
jgi:hypothetical protein